MESFEATGACFIEIRLSLSPCARSPSQSKEERKLCKHRESTPNAGDVNIELSYAVTFNLGVAHQKNKVGQTPPKKK